jgi:hypothetical protein
VGGLVLIGQCCGRSRCEHRPVSSIMLASTGQLAASCWHHALDAELRTAMVGTRCERTVACFSALPVESPVSCARPVKEAQAATRSTMVTTVTTFMLTCRPGAMCRAD